MSNKARDQKPTRPNAHLEERLEAVKNGPGKLLKPKKAKAKAQPEVAQAEPEAVTAADTPPVAASPRGYHPDAYGLEVADGSLGLHATPGAIVVVEPEIPTKAGLAVFYLKGQPVPAIFDLPRTFRPYMALPFAPESEIMPVVEAFAPETGALCRISSDRIEKVHRIIGIQTPVDSSTAWRPMPKRLPEFAQCPEGMGEHVVTDASMYPFIRPGETVVFDPSQRDPEKVVAFVLEWSNGTRSVLETNLRQRGAQAGARWWVDPVNRPIGDGALERRMGRGPRNSMLFASDGPFTEETLRERIVGRVVGILAPQERPRDDDSQAYETLPALPAASTEPEAPASPAPGSPEARAAWYLACREHSIRTAHLNDCPELTRSKHDIWTVQSLTKAMETGEITVAEFARLQPIASGRELRFAEITHELRIGELFALAYADEYPVASDEDEPASVEPDPIFAAIERHNVARAACVGLDDGVDKEGYENAHDRAFEAREIVESMQPTTVAGLLTLAQHLNAVLNEDLPGQPVEGTIHGHAFVALINACLGLADNLEGSAAIEADAELLQLGRRFEAARARETAACDACNAAQEEADRHMPERPACLTLTPADHPLNITSIWTYAEALSGIRIGPDGIQWLRGKMPMTHEVLRPIREGERAHIDHPGRKFDIVPHPEAQARAEEIITAWDAWQAEKDRIQAQYVTAELEDEAETAGAATIALAHRIAALPARTAAGFRVKLTALACYNPSFFYVRLPELPDPDQILAHSLMRDVQAGKSDLDDATAEADAEAFDTDPVFAAIAASQQAEAEMTAFARGIGGRRMTQAEISQENGIIKKQSETRETVWATLPTTAAGLRALAEYLQEQAALLAGEDWRDKAGQSDFGDYFLGLLAGVEALHGTAADQDAPITVESAASLTFEPYTFDMPLRSPQEWAGEFSMHAIAMHIADKTLRMTKPELMAFIRDAAKRGNDTDGIMYKALNAASSTFDGWAKFLHLAGTRYLVAGASTAVEDETEEGGA